MNMKILQADAQHAGVIVRKVAELITEIVGKPFAYDETEVLGFIDDALASGNYLAFLAVDEREKVVGIITVGESGAVYAGGRFGVIHEFYIDPGLRSRGIGRLLIEEVKRKSLSLNWKRLEVSAPPFPQWKKSRDFYLREGFQKIGPRLRWPSKQPHPEQE
jgi:GNAT superfamily N-acetyltransferase